MFGGRYIRSSVMISQLCSKGFAAALPIKSGRPVPYAEHTRPRDHDYPLFSTLMIAVNVFQLRVVTGTPKSLSILLR